MLSNYRDIIKAPIITEKSTAIASNEKSYVFNVHPKKKRVGRHAGMTNKYKKAIVTLKDGNKIEL